MEFASLERQNICDQSHCIELLVGSAITLLGSTSLEAGALCCALLNSHYLAHGKYLLNESVAEDTKAQTLAFGTLS